MERKMKKKILFVIFAIFGLSYSFASPAAVDFSKLPQDEKFTEHMQYFLSKGYYSLRGASPDKETKAEQLQKTESFYNYLQSLPKTDYNERVLKLLLMRCLYNYDVVSSSEIQKEVDFLNKNYKKNAEHHWIYGNFLVSSGKTVTGRDELEEFMKMKDYNVNQLFIDDYAYAQVMCGKTLNALYTITNGGRITEERIENKSLLNMIKGQLEETSVSKPYEQTDVWKISEEQKDGYRYVYSTMFGISVPCKGEWKLAITPYTPGKPVLCRVGVNDFSLEGHNIGINLMIFAYPDSFFSDSVKQNFIKNLPIIKTENVIIDKKKFEKHTYQDLSKYNDIRKGSKGYFYYSKIVPEEFSGARCEMDVDFSSLNLNQAESIATSSSSTDSGDSNSAEKSPKVSFYRVSPTKKHLAEPIHFLIFVDSCVALDKETSDFLEDFFSKSIFE